MILRDFHARPDDSAASVEAREAEMTAGLWLPVAMARVVQALQGCFGGRPQKTSEIIRGFCLPMLAVAVAADEAKAEADELIAGFEQLKKRFSNNG